MRGHRLLVYRDVLLGVVCVVLVAVICYSVVVVQCLLFDCCSVLFVCCFAFLSRVYCLSVRCPLLMFMV